MTEEKEEISLKFSKQMTLFLLHHAAGLKNGERERERGVSTWILKSREPHRAEKKTNCFKSHIQNFYISGPKQVTQSQAKC